MEAQEPQLAGFMQITIKQQSPEGQAVVSVTLAAVLPASCVPALARKAPMLLALKGITMSAVQSCMPAPTKNWWPVGLSMVILQRGRARV